MDEPPRPHQQHASTRRGEAHTRDILAAGDKSASARTAAPPPGARASLWPRELLYLRP